MNQKDIYFTEEYCKIFEENKDGKLETILFESDLGIVLYRYLKREVPMKIDGVTYYDTITPYGYGGPIIIKIDNIKKRTELINEFNHYLAEKFNEKKIVSSFIRFSPLLKNHELFKNEMIVEHNRNTIVLDLNSKEIIWENIHSKCRNMIKKAEKNGVNIEIKKINNINEIKIFYSLYLKTMLKNNANIYYMFSEEFFINTFKLLNGNIKLVNAIYENKIIASSIILEYGKYLHYHFSGSDINYKNLAGTNLLLYKVAVYGFENNFKYFHLGGGYLDNYDSLFKFKKSFNKNYELEFYTGKKIYNIKIYKELVKKKNLSIENKDFFPLYRNK